MSACGAASTPKTPNTPDTPAAEPAVEFDPADFSEKVDFSMSFAYMDSEAVMRIKNHFHEMF